MTRMDAYFIVKSILCRHGAIPASYESYEKLVLDLMALLEETAG